MADEVVREATLRRHHVSEDDLSKQLRLKAKMTEPNQVKLACLERSGEISFIPKDTGK
ncbi:YetF domain-containing protein [Prosthecobacter sp.]|uniref:YetF domain-containing protein n=1 Tax=Prosthecobacter sp. TaxID=1965333 RepID=UPI003782EA78